MAGTCCELKIALKSDQPNLRPGKFFTKTQQLFPLKKNKNK